MGRRAGSPNRGYFYRSGRGRYTSVNGRMVALRNDEEVPIKDKNTSVAIPKAAYRKIIAQSTDAVNTVAFSQSQDERQAQMTLANRIHDGYGRLPVRTRLRRLLEFI